MTGIMGTVLQAALISRRSKTAQETVEYDLTISTRIFANKVFCGSYELFVISYDISHLDRHYCNRKLAIALARRNRLALTIEIGSAIGLVIPSSTLSEMKYY